MKTSEASILVVDDEEMVVKALLRTFELNGYSAVGITDPCQALDLLSKRRFAVIISDQRMPSKSGVELLQAAREISPNTVRIIVTGYTDLDVVITAVNQGQIYYYFAKPWEESELLRVVDQALVLHEKTEAQERADQQIQELTKNKELLISQLKAMLGQNLTNSVNTLQKIVEVKDLELLQHGQRVNQYARQLADLMELSAPRKINLEYASLFHDIGKIAIRDHVLDKQDLLTEHELNAIRLHSAYGAEILGELGFFDEVADIVLQHHENYDGTGYPQGLRGTEIRLEARIIAIADSYDRLISTQDYQEKVPHEDVIKKIVEASGARFDPYLVNLLFWAKRNARIG
ncbi:MAG: HD domain-containing phosphohydrolase [Negativicutes bacterium]|nr:HD domain-containing phosphohydrolase [Negativicutes bacterium]